jgi:predicted GIY-YIG superfamily endonuclease
MKELLVAALEVTGQGFSADRVVADPTLNAAFLHACAQRGLCGSPAELNRTLLNLRKRGLLSGRNSKKTTFVDEDDYRFAAEMAMRFLERRDGVSLDEVICDPQRATEFDELAARIAPGYTSLQYRWAALNVRKSNRLKPELLAKVARPVDVHSFRVDDIDSGCIPATQGLYLFFMKSAALYAGESQYLRQRIEKHLEHSDNNGLARWLWTHGKERLHLEIQILAPDTSTRIRRALELELIRSRSPEFNIKR